VGRNARYPAMKSESRPSSRTAQAERSLRRLVRDGVFWLTAAKVLSHLISWSITIYVIRILSPSDYGLMAMAWVYLNFVTLFNELGLSAAIVQKKDIDHEDLSNIYWAVLCINVALYGLSVLAAPLIAGFYDEPRVTELIRVAAVALIIRSFGFVAISMLSREMAFNKQSRAEVIGNASGAVGTLLLAMQGFGVWSLVYGYVLMEIIKNVLCVLFYPWRPRLSFSLSKAGALIDFGAKVAVARLFWYLYSNMDLLIAGKLLGKTQLGYYSIAVQLASIPLDKMVSTIAQVAFPAFSKVQNDPVLLKRYYLKIVNLVAFVSFPVCCGFALVADIAVPLLLSEKWLPVILPLQILSAIASLRAIHMISAPLTIAIGKAGITLANNAIITVALAVSFAIGSSYGLAGFAYSWLVFPFVFLITTSLTLRLIGLSLTEYFKELRHPFLATGLMVLSVASGQKLLFVSYGLVTQAAGSVLLGILSYLAYYVLFNRGMFAEARSILRR
jgi:teichuronic acid exporter